jgi:hypothetical protein
VLERHGAARLKALLEGSECKGGEKRKAAVSEALGRLSGANRAAKRAVKKK